MNILITGANGFIGQHLVEHLKKTNSVIELVHSKKYSSTKMKIYCDLLNQKHLDKMLNEQIKIDTIIHTASKLASNENINNLSLLYDNLIMYEHISLMAKKLTVSKIINFSSIAVYPNIDGEYFEHSEVSPSHNNDCLYGLSKFCGENILNFLNKGINIVHARIAQVYGEGMREDRIFNIMKQELHETNMITVYGSGRRVSGFISIDILIQKVVFFLKNDLLGVYNVSEKNLSYHDLALQLIDKYGDDKSQVKLIKNGLASKCLINTNKLKQMELKYGM